MQSFFKDDVKSGITLSILSLISDSIRIIPVVFQLVAIVLAIIAFRQCAKAVRAGKPVAYIGVILSLPTILLAIASFAVLGIILTSHH